MDLHDLTRKHPEHAKRSAAWAKWRAVYEGTEAVIRGGYFKQHERESDANYKRRCDEALTWGISRSVVDLFAQYLFAEEVTRDYGRLGNDELFGRFLEDSDLQGMPMAARLREDSKWAAVYGHVGYLVDRPSVASATRRDDLALDLRPYLVRYFPTAILDWTFRRENGKLTLHYIKLLDTDGTYRLWWQDRWEVWEVTELGEPQKTGEGANPLGTIPFVWLYSTPSPDTPGIGLSDLAELARVDMSIMANVSQGDEVVTYAAFPMMRKARVRAGMGETDDTGPTAVLEFDPEFPDSKPDWLEAQVKEPIDAIMGWIAAKEARAYKLAHASFVAGVGGATAKSGVALAMEFTELGAALARKARGLQQAEEAIYRLWAAWQGVEWDGHVRYPSTFEIEDMGETLQNLLTAKVLVPSRTFAAETAKRAARMAIPDMDPDTQAKIDRECDGGASYQPPGD